MKEQGLFWYWIVQESSLCVCWSVSGKSVRIHQKAVGETRELHGVLFGRCKKGMFEVERC